MSETHRRILITMEGIRVIGIFYAFSCPLIVIERKEGMDFMQQHQWKKEKEFDTNVKSGWSIEERLLLMFIFTCGFNEEEKELTQNVW
jgi:hypothetical protein